MKRHFYSIDHYIYNIICLYSEDHWMENNDMIVTWIFFRHLAKYTYV